jgi:hypothetical protein
MNAAVLVHRMEYAATAAPIAPPTPDVPPANSRQLGSHRQPSLSSAGKGDPLLPEVALAHLTDIPGRAEARLCAR